MKDPFEKFDKRFNFMWSVFWIFFFVAAAALILWYALIGYVAVKAVDHVEQQGLKHTIERIWEGPQHERGKNINQ